MFGQDILITTDGDFTVIRQYTGVGRRPVPISVICKNENRSVMYRLCNVLDKSRVEVCSVYGDINEGTVRGKHAFIDLLMLPEHKERIPPGVYERLFAY